MRRAVLASVAAALVLVGGCSGTASRSGSGAPRATAPVSGPGVIATPTVPPTVPPTPPPRLVACPDAARTILSAASGRTSVRVTAEPASGFTRCGYRTSASSPTSCSAADLTINTAAQAYVDFDRWVDEQEQNSSIGQPGLAPELVHAPKLGIEVDWVPAHQTLETGRPGRWITVAMQCGRRAGALHVARLLAATVAGH